MLCSSRNTHLKCYVPVEIQTCTYLKCYVPVEIQTCTYLKCYVPVEILILNVMFQ